MLCDIPTNQILNVLVHRHLRSHILCADGISESQFTQLQTTINLVASATGPDTLPDRLEAAALLKELGSDHHTIVASILGGSTARHAVTLESIAEDVSAAQMLLIKNVRWLNSFNVASRDGEFALTVATGDVKTCLLYTSPSPRDS